MVGHVSKMRPNRLPLISCLKNSPAARGYTEAQDNPRRVSWHPWHSPTSETVATNRLSLWRWETFVGMKRIWVVLSGESDPPPTLICDTWSRLFRGNRRKGIRKEDDDPDVRMWAGADYYYDYLIIILRLHQKIQIIRKQCNVPKYYS